MKRKPARNRFRDMVGDYYKTNRHISKEESRREGFKGPMSAREKSMIIVIILLILFLVVKSCFLDEVKNLSAEEAQFKDYVEYAVQKDMMKDDQGFHFMSYRVYDIFMADRKQQTELSYVDPVSGKTVEAVQDGRYTARVRGYFLWVIPVKHFSVTAPTPDQQPNGDQSSNNKSKNGVKEKDE